MPVCLSVCVSVLPSSLGEAATALQSGGHASHPQENLQGTVRLSLRRLNDQLTSVLDCCLRFFFGIVYARPDTHGHWRTQSVTQTNTVWLPCFPRMPQSLSLWTLDTESRDAVTRLCWHSTASQSECFFLLFFFFLMQTWKELLTWPPTDLPPRMLDQNTSVLILNSVIKHPENFNPSSSSLTEDADDGAAWTNRERLCLPGGVAFSHRVDFLSWKILRTVLCWIHSSNMPINIHINEVELCDPVDQLFTLYLNTWVGYI